MLAVVFGSSMGNTKEIAEQIAKELNGEAIDVASTSPANLNKYDKLIFGTSTWGSGDLQDDWEQFDFSALELKGKKVALFGLGDGDSYADTFCDGMGKIYEMIKDKGAKIVGFTDPSGYEFDSSEALHDGKFVGLALDNDNQSDQTPTRIAEWIEIIKAEF